MIKKIINIKTQEIITNEPIQIVDGVKVGHFDANIYKTEEQRSKVLELYLKNPNWKEFSQDTPLQVNQNTMAEILEAKQKQFLSIEKELEVKAAELEAREKELQEKLDSLEAPKSEKQPKAEKQPK